MNKKTSWNQSLHQRYKYLGSFPHKIFETILMMDKDRTQRNTSKFKEIADDTQGLHPSYDWERLHESIRCLNFWDEAWWYLSLRVFGQLSSLFLYSHRFNRYIFRPSSGVSCWTRQLSQNFELRPLFNPRGLLALIPFTITGYKCQVFLYCHSPAVWIEPATPRWLSL